MNKKEEITMATYVYLDKERTKRLDAKKYNPAIHKEKKLYCLNPKCVMKMHYVSASGNKNAYFAASPTYVDGIKMEHQGYCKVLAKGIDLTRHDPKLFSFPDCLMKLFPKKKDGAVYLLDVKKDILSS